MRNLIIAGILMSGLAASSPLFAQTNADDVTQVQKLKELKILLSHHIESHINLHARPTARNVGESRFAMGPEGHDAARDAHFHALGFQLLCAPRAKLLDDLPGGVSPGKFMRIGGLSQGLDFA